jgi:hypothetical protein
MRRVIHEWHWAAAMCDEESGKTAADSHGGGFRFHEDTCDAHTTVQVRTGSIMAHPTQVGLAPQARPEAR